MKTKQLTLETMSLFSSLIWCHEGQIQSEILALFSFVVLGGGFVTFAVEHEKSEVRVKEEKIREIPIKKEDKKCCFFNRASK